MLIRACCSLACVAALVPVLLAAEADKPAAIPADLVDADFEGKIDLALVRAAIAQLDAAKLIDQSGRLARAEKEVGRPHKGVPAKALLALSLRVIDERRDKAALQSLSALLAELQIKDYDAKITLLLPLMDKARRVDAGPNVPLSETTKEGIEVYNAYKNQIKLARVIGDRSALDSLRRNIELAEELHPKQRQHLVAILTDAFAAVPAKPGADQLALAKLTANLYTAK
jgi:hypothetical protein